MVKRNGHEYCQRARDHFRGIPARLMASGRVGCVNCMEIFIISHHTHNCAKGQVEASSLFRVSALKDVCTVNDVLLCCGFVKTLAYVLTRQRCVKCLYG